MNHNTLIDMFKENSCVIFFSFSKLSLTANDGNTVKYIRERFIFKFLDKRIRSRSILKLKLFIILAHSCNLATCFAGFILAQIQL